MLSKKAANSIENLLRLLKVQSNHDVVTIEDLNADYDEVPPAVATLDSSRIDGDDDPVATSSGQAESVGTTGTVTINNYYTWNSHRTYKSFYK